MSERPAADNRELVSSGDIDLGFLDEVDALLAEVDEAVKEGPLTNKNTDEILYPAFTPSRRLALERIYPELREREVRIHETDLLRRLRDIRGLNPITQEIEPPLDEDEPTDTRDAIVYTIEKIMEEKVVGVRETAQGLVEKVGMDKYAASLQVIHQLQAVKTILDGTATGLDRRFFDYTSPEIEEGFYRLKNEVSAIMRQAGEERRSVVAECLPIVAVQETLARTDLNVASIEGAATLLEDSIATMVHQRFPGNPNQTYLFNEIARDLLTAVREQEASDDTTKLKVLMLEVPSRMEGWVRYKTLSKLNENYVGDGVANIGLADDLIAYGSTETPIALFGEVVQSGAIFAALHHEVPEALAREVFTGEIAAIYESRVAIGSVLEAARGESEIISPKEAMFEIARMSEAMNRGAVDEVLAIVERLEGRQIDLYHVTADRYGFESILQDGRLLSNWANRKYGDTFFGGGLYFWAAQQEDWLKGGAEAIHIVYPMRDLFIIKNKYNNPQRGPFSAAGYTQPYPDSQKKSNLIAMIPANALRLQEHEESEQHPLSNEGYTAQTIEDVTKYEVEEANFIWRIDKHYGHYDTNYFISPEAENKLREVFGEGVKIERGVTAPGFIGGEYDRLVIPRSISVLKATSVAHALRIAEVVYEDQLASLHREIETQRQDDLQYYRESIADRGEIDPQVAGFIETIKENPQFDERDRLVLEYYLSRVDASVVQNYLEELTSLEEALGTNFPSRERLQQLVPLKEWFNRESTMHGTPHIMRVMVDMEILARLGQSSLPEGERIDLDALELATMLHDVKRLKDSASDYRHGERAAEFLDTLVAANPEAFASVDIDLAKRIMHFHSIDDYEGMTPEELIFKDADALDRYRFNSGPDMRYMRTPFAEATLNSAYNLAALSQFLLSNGYTRAEAVLKAAEALRLVR